MYCSVFQHCSREYCVRFSHRRHRRSLFAIAQHSERLEGIARNPGASGSITTAMIIGLALIESLVIYVLVVCLILLIVNPFGI